jgi:hypothetical protein
MKSPLTPFLLIAGVFFALSGCVTQGSNEAAAAPDDANNGGRERYVGGESLTIHGLVRRTGSEPFTRLIITDAGGTDWYLDPEGEALLEGLEQEQVEVCGIVRLRPMERADGTRLGVRHELVSVELVSTGNSRNR